MLHPGAAGKPQVFLFICAAPCLWDNVVKLQRPEHVLLRTPAIATAVPSLHTHTGTNGRRDPTGAHGANGSRRPRRTASCSAWALRNSPSW